jgi:glycosyltransferase involved in cell wall biosynthesis
VQGWVHEIIVVVNDAADPTIEVARRFGSRVFVRAWTGFGAQKRFAEEQCSQQWLFNLDADEVVSLNLKDRLLSLFARGEPGEDAYAMPIRFRFAFETRPHRWAYANSPIRLYNRSKARFRDHPVHDSVIPLEGVIPWKTCKIPADIYHCSFRGLSHFITKINHYSDMQAAALHSTNRHPSAARVLVEPFVAFFKCYTARRYFLYGVHGVTYAALWAVMRMTRLAKVRELEKLTKSGKLPVTS